MALTLGAWYRLESGSVAQLAARLPSGAGVMLYPPELEDLADADPYPTVWSADHLTKAVEVTPFTVAVSVVRGADGRLVAELHPPGAQPSLAPLATASCTVYADSAALVVPARTEALDLTPEAPPSSTL